MIGKSASDTADLIRTASPRGRLLFAAGTVFMGATAWSGYWVMIGRYIQSTDDAYVGGEVTTLSFKVPGVIETVAIVDNQAVKAGDLLLKLDDRDFRERLAGAEANIKARVSMLGQTRADLAAAIARRVWAKQEIDRYRTLSKAQYASLQRFQQADADYKSSEATEDKAKAAFELAEANLDQAIADRNLARLNLSYTEIHSPIDGFVGNRSARVGSYATVGAELLAIVPAHGLWVDANFRESQLAGMRKGQPAEIVADVLPGMIFHGRVESLSPATGAQFSVIPPENATGNFTKIVQRVPVRILLDDNDAELGRLRPGLSVAVSVDERQSTGAAVDDRQETPVRDDKERDPPVRDDDQPAPPVLDAQR